MLLGAARQLFRVESMVRSAEVDENDRGAAIISSERATEGSNLGEAPSFGNSLLETGVIPGTEGALRPTSSNIRPTVPARQPARAAET
jgi:hypothetical protein